MGIRIITDSASDMIAERVENFEFIPLTVTFGEEEYLDGINLSHQEFYEKLIENDELPHTSQATPFVFEEAYKRAVENGDEVLVITMSAKLSGTWQSAVTAAGSYEGKVGNIINCYISSVFHHIPFILSHPVIPAPMTCG